jgi:DNA-binding CsgD family transcriptional regulator
MIAEGKTSIQIAEELFLSNLTVDTHRKNMLQKFGVKNTAELIIEATRQNLL